MNPDIDSGREQYEFTVTPDLAGVRIDVLLTRLIGNDVSRTRVQAMLKDGWTTVNGAPCTLPRTIAEAGDVIRIDAPEQRIVTRAEGEDIPLDILYEDDDVVVVNKPAGMVVHPAAGNWSGTVVNALLGRDPELIDDDGVMDPLRPGIVHRLDKDTSGALVAAKTPKALRKLTKAFADRKVSKVYLAIVFGWPVPQAAVIRTLYGRHPADRKKMTVLRRETPDAREAVTAYKVIRQGLWNGRKVALLEVRLHTGRTHQIRVHMAYKGYPLLGEKVYNAGRTSDAPRQMLHAWKLAFTHPVTGEEMEFEAPVPDDFREVANAIVDSEK